MKKCEQEKLTVLFSTSENHESDVGEKRVEVFSGDIKLKKYDLQKRQT